MLKITGANTIKNIHHLHVRYCIRDTVKAVEVSVEVKAMKWFEVSMEV